MTKVVNVGRFAVTALLIGAALWCLAYLVLNLREISASFSRMPETQPAPGEALGVMIDARLVAWIPLFISAWGIFKWRQWGHILTTVLSALMVLSSIVGAISFGIRPRNTLQGLVALMVLVWLLLPAVRVEYWRQDRMVAQTHE